MLAFRTNGADGNRQGRRNFSRRLRFFPSPLVGEGGSTARSDGETDEGFVSASLLVERTPHPALRATFSRKGRRKKALLPRLLAAGLAVALEAVEVHADVRGFGRGIRQGNGTVEGCPGLVVAAELHQEGAAHAEEVKIV